MGLALPSAWPPPPRPGPWREPALRGCARLASPFPPRLPLVASSGGVFASAPAAITSVSCVTGCARVDSAQPGSLLRIDGMNMGDVSEVVFIGAAGNTDNTIARVVRARGDSVDAIVPVNSSSGRLRAVNADGSRSVPAAS